jgi:hypothetical protein
MSLDRTMRESVQELGFTLLRRSKHNIWAHPCGVRLVTAVSPSDHRAVKNSVSVAKRLLRQAGVAA